MAVPRRWGVWAALLVAVALPMIVAGSSPLLAWRDPIYIIAGGAGVLALALLLFQPLLIERKLLGLSGRTGPILHKWVGGALVAAVLIHVAGLWLTSPPDVIDVLLVRSPTPFSIWGVVAMWAVFATALLAMTRRRMRLRPRVWRGLHMLLAALIVGGTVVHAMMIEGTMGTLSKAFLCLLVLVATAKVIAQRL